MKNYFILFFVVSIFSFCSCKTGIDNTKSDNVPTAEKELKSETPIENKTEDVINTPVHLTKAKFIEKVFDYENNTEWKYEGDKPCIIDFYADWCGPCKMIAPVLDNLAKEYAGQIIIYKINTDKERELAGAFGIRSIPTLLFCPKEGQPQMVSGAIKKQDFKKVIDEVLLVDKNNNANIENE